MINPHIFRAYDLRGVAGTDLTEETMYLIGQGFGTYMIRNHGPKLVVGRDNRTHGESLQSAFINGLQNTGCHVINIGLATSPLLYFASCILDVDGGSNVTASHNPKEDNGVKFVAKNAHSICGDQIQEILKLIQTNDFEKGKGSLKKIDVFPQYIEKVQSQIKLARPLKIVIDCGNGVAGKFAPELFKQLGTEVIELYCELDGNFPNHPADPSDPANMKDLSKKVIEEKADLGIGFDGDGDRIGVVDEKGQLYAADQLLILLAQDLLKRNQGAKIVFDVKCSLVLADEIKKAGGEPIMAKTGHSFIEAKMREIKSLLAGEASGHMFFGENYYGFDDATLAGSKLLQILANTSGTFSDLLKDVPKTFTTPELKAKCADHLKFEIIKKIIEEFKNLEGPSQIITIDGARVEFADGTWGATRCSNTSPYLTLRFEAQTKERLQEIQNLFYQIMSKYPEVENEWYKK